MTVHEALARVDEIRPGEVGVNTLLTWLSNLDGQLYEEVIKNHEGIEDTPHGPYRLLAADEETGEETAEDATLMIPEPYSEIYIHLLMAYIDYLNGEFDRYNNEIARYNSALSTYINWINRNHMPKQAHYIRY